MLPLVAVDDSSTLNSSESDESQNRMKGSDESKAASWGKAEKEKGCDCLIPRRRRAELKSRHRFRDEP